MIRERRAVERLAVFLVLVFVLQSCSAEMGDAPGSEVEEPLEESIGVSRVAAVSSVAPMSLSGREVVDESPVSSLTSVSAGSKSGYTPVAMERRPVSYLREVVPPCLPFDESGRDPCLQGVPALLKSAGVSGRWVSYDYLPTFDDILLGKVKDEVVREIVPHIAIRGLVQVGSTRCDLYMFKKLSYVTYLSGGPPYYYCFVDITVHDYIVGEGPDELTVAMHREVVYLYPDQLENWLNIRDEFVMNRLEDPQSRTAAAYEGREMVLLLRTPYTTTVETLARSGELGTVWFLQRDGEDEIRAVDQATWLVIDELQSHFDLPLSELEERIKKAAENRAVVTDGRIGVDSSLPLLVTDANQLQDFFVSVGAVYEGDDATVLPPPVPGGDEPEQDPTQTDVEEPVPVPPVPGEEENVPLPVDDAVTTSTSPTTQPQAEDVAPPTTGTTLPPAGADTTVPAVDTGTTRPQAEDAASSTTSTTEPPDDDEDAALPEEGDELPTPTGTTRPWDDGGGAGPSVGDDAGVGTGQ